MTDITQSEIATMHARIRVFKADGYPEDEANRMARNWMLYDRNPHAVKKDKVGQWQPIETAPYSQIVLLAIEGKYLTTGFRGRVMGWTWDSVDEEPLDGTATHWMPLPAPPEAS